MKFLAPLIFLMILVYIGYPYVNLFRLDRALMANDQSELTALIDLDTLKETQKKHFENRVRSSPGGAGMMPDFMKEGVRWMGDTAVNTYIDMNWVREKLRWRKSGRVDAYPSIISDMSYAFFESPSRFLIRLGDLGQQPIHVRMEFKDWHWRVTEIYD